MSVRLTRASNHFITATPITYTGDYTICGWIILRTLATFGGIFATGNSDSGVEDDGLGMDNTNVLRFRCVVNSVTKFSSTAPPTLTSGVPYFVALRRSGTSLGMWWGNVTTTVTEINAQTGDPAGRGAATATYIGGRSGNTLGAAFFGLKAWERALTPAQLQQEQWSWRPTGHGNLWGWWPLTQLSDLTDYSGNGHHLTANNGPFTTEDNGPISWGGRHAA